MKRPAFSHRHPAGRRLLTLGSLLATTLSAQVSTWTGQGNLATFGDWNNPALWDTGTVPGGSAAIAVINQVTPAYRNYPDGPYVNANPSAPASVPGGGLPIITGPVTLGAVRFDLPAASYPSLAALYVGNPGNGTAGSLRLDGAGLDLRAPAGNYGADVNVTPGSSLTLASRAQLTRSSADPLYLYLSDSTATAANPAQLVFRDDAAVDPSTARWLTVYTRGASSIVFQDRARAGNTSFQLGNLTKAEFHNTASADSAIFNLGNGNLLLFDGDSTAASSRINFNGNSYAPNSAIVRFAGRSSAASSVITTLNSNLGAVEFTEQAVGNGINITARRLDITGAATAGGATGRQRAGVSGLAPASVVAADARTVSVGAVYLQDVLLGSNTLEVTGGYILNVRDSGGAYLSAAGENLVGGGLLKTGPDTLSLLGPSYDYFVSNQPSYNVLSGLTTIRGGTIQLFNRLASVNVEAAGTLVNGSSLAFVEGTLQNAGTVRPSYGYNPGAPLRVVGNYVQTPTGTLDIYAVNSPGFYGQLSVSGAATLAGRLNLYATSSFFPNRAPGTATLNILQAGSVSGRFDTVTSPWIRIKSVLTYRTDGVTAQLELLPIAALAATPGQQALGAYLDTVHQSTTYSFMNDYRGIEDGLNSVDSREKYQAVLANFSPDRYGAIVEAGFAAATARVATLDRQLGAARTPAGRGPGLFLEGGRRESRFAAIDGLPETRPAAGGGLAGAYWQGGPLLFGAYLARETSSFDLDAAGSHAAIRSTEPGLFAQYRRGRFFAQAAAGFSRDVYQLRRAVDYVFFSPLVVTDSAAPSGRRTDLSVSAGWTFKSGGWSIAPSVGLLDSRWSIGDFTEANGTSYQMDPLTFSHWASHSLRSRAGFDLAYGSPKHRLQPRLTVTWLHEFDEDRSIPARFAGAPAGYLAPGRAAETDLVQAGLGVDWRLTRQLGFSVNAGLAEGKNTRTISDLSASLRWSF